MPEESDMTPEEWQRHVQQSNEPRRDQKAEKQQSGLNESKSGRNDRR